MSAATITQPPAAPPLTQAEQRVLSAFQTMDGRRKNEALFYMEEIAKEFPCELRPVTGGAA